jgi:hypothetical protein
MTNSNSREDTSALSAIIRLKAGLSPLHYLDDLTVDLAGHKSYLCRLLNKGSGQRTRLGIVLGAYGSGKTHFLQVAKRHALSGKFAVAQLSQDTGLGSLVHPQRHVFNLLTSLTLPQPYGPALDWLASSLNEPQETRALEAAFREIQSDCPVVAGSALWILRNVSPIARAPLLLDYLSGASLVGKTAHLSMRVKAYQLLRFWTVLCTRVLECTGTVLLIDELETLFSNAVYWSIISRRSAYRSLSYYTENLPLTTTICAFTPEGWANLRGEMAVGGSEFFNGACDYPMEDISRLFRLFLAERPHELTPLTDGGYRTLFERLSHLHIKARGYPRSWISAVEVPRSAPEMTPRIFSKSVVAS